MADPFPCQADWRPFLFSQQCDRFSTLQALCACPKLQQYPMSQSCALMAGANRAVALQLWMIHMHEAEAPCAKDNPFSSSISATLAGPLMLRANPKTFPEEPVAPAGTVTGIGVQGSFPGVPSQGYLDALPQLPGHWPSGQPQRHSLRSHWHLQVSWVLSERWSSSVRARSRYQEGSQC